MVDGGWVPQRFSDFAQNFVRLSSQHINCNNVKERDLFSCSRALGLTRSLLLGTPAPLGLCVAAMMIMSRLVVVIIMI